MLITREQRCVQGPLHPSQLATFYSPAGTRQSTHLAPDATEVGALLEGLRLVHEGDALAEVELGLVLGLATLDRDQRRVRVLIGQTAAAWVRL